MSISGTHTVSKRAYESVESVILCLFGWGVVENYMESLHSLLCAVEPRGVTLCEGSRIQRLRGWRWLGYGGTKKKKENDAKE